jgi:probable F420-dependent oxidoreductase
VDVGIALPSFGLSFGTMDPQWMAGEIEGRGFHSIWLGDHIALPHQVNSKYPMTADGRFPYSGVHGAYESLTTLSFVAGVTTRCKLGIGVCVVPLREPLLLTKQVATIASLSGGRLLFGAGAGWLKEEYEAIGASWENRGSRVDDIVSLLRESWTGKLTAHDVEIDTHPTPPGGDIPIYIGGMSPRAQRRALEHGAGWYAATPPLSDRVGDELINTITAYKQRAETYRDGPRRRDEGEVAVNVPVRSRLLESTHAQPVLATELGRLGAARVDMVVISFDWRDAETARRRLDVIGAAAIH